MTLCVAATGCLGPFTAAGPDISVDLRIDGLPPLTPRYVPDGTYSLTSPPMTITVATLPSGARTFTLAEQVTVLDGGGLDHTLSRLGEIGGPGKITAITLDVSQPRATDPVLGTPIDLSALSAFTVSVDGTRVLDLADLTGTATSLPPVELGLGALAAIKDALFGHQPVVVTVTVAAVIPAGALATALPPDVEITAKVATELSLTP